MLRRIKKFFKQSTIRSRLLISFLAMAVIPSLGISVGTFVFGLNEGFNQVNERLESAALLKEIELNSWIQALQSDLGTLINRDYSIEWLEVVLRLEDRNQHYDIVKNAVRTRFSTFMNQSQRFQDLLLLDLDGKILVSSNSDREETIIDFSHEILESMSSPGDFQVVLETDPFVFLIPLFSGDGIKLGYIGGTLNFQPPNDILEDRTGLGTSGEAYLIISNDDYSLKYSGEMNMQSSFINPIKINNDLQNILSTIQDSESSWTGLLLNDQGTRVLGVARWVSEIDSGLIIEISIQEAFGSILGSLLISLVVIIIGVFLAVFSSLTMTRSIAIPLENLAENAAQIESGSIQQFDPVERHDEIGVLSKAFHNMTNQLQNLISTLEDRVQERTNELENANTALRNKAVQLETSAKVSKEVVSILEYNKLLFQVSKLILDAFKYYHVNIFLLDEEKKELVLQSYAGKQKPNNVVIALNSESLNAKAFTQNFCVCENDSQSNKLFMKDQNLPNTRSELVIPINIGSKTIGTIDVHSARVNAFSSDDVLVIQSLGDQIAIAIENIRLNEQSRHVAVLEERNRLARELHDSVTQSIYSLSIMSEGLRRLIINGQMEKVSDRLASITVTAQNSLQEMRLLIHELRPTILSEDGFIEAIRQRLDAVENRSGINARFFLDELIDIPDNYEDELYRITQEALNNALKHSNAANVELKLFCEDNSIILEISDDGIGFEYDNGINSGGMGLQNMIERAKKLDGKINIETSPNSGTKIQVRIPFIKQK